MNISLSITKQNIKSLLIVMFLLFSTGSQAHFIWLDPIMWGQKTDNSNSKFYNYASSGTAKMARLYFGEYADNLFETKDSKLGKRKTSTLKAFFPKNKKGALIPLTMQDNFYGGILKTNKYGVVNLVAQDIQSPVSDRSKRGGGIVKPMYYARTQWLLFDNKKVSARINPVTPETQLDILPITQHINSRTGDFGPKIGEEVVFQVYFNNKPLVKKPDAVNIFAPNGWTNKVKLDKQGMGHFTPLWQGIYVVETVYKDKIPGNFKGVAFELTKHLATLSLAVMAKQ
ncbi:MAG: DUF4198 domain-containing protein [Methylococcales symbiont of Hymedesmia sp. n. MRB-2018]|nr:MAG: DUF4198 domain-containing protein [Methylococcales symbiont of Hymedesmia sp. n. MRB-2018]